MPIKKDVKDLKLLQNYIYLLLKSLFSEVKEMEEFTVYKNDMDHEPSEELADHLESIFSSWWDDPADTVDANRDMGGKDWIEILLGNLSPACERRMRNYGGGQDIIASLIFDYSEELLKDDSVFALYHHMLELEKLKDSFSITDQLH